MVLVWIGQQLTYRAWSETVSYVYCRQLRFSITKLSLPFAFSIAKYYGANQLSPNGDREPPLSTAGRMSMYNVDTLTLPELAVQSSAPTAEPMRR